MILLAVNPLIIVSIVLVVLIGAMIALYFVGNKMQKKQMAQREQVMEAAQPMTMMIIDKKYMKMKEAKLPKIVMEQTPKRYHNAKMPVVKVKVGPQIMTLIADDAIYDEIPSKGEIKAMVSGIYIVGVKTVRGKVTEEDNGKKKKKQTLGAKMRKQQAEYQKQYAAEEKSKAERKAQKQAEKRKKEIESRIMK